MNYKNIPNTELKVASICLGSALFGSTVDKQISFELMDNFQHKGGNFIDTAHIYADWLPGEKSISEKTIGEWIKVKKNRYEIIIGTKGAHPDFSHMEIARLSKEDVISDVDGSLKALQTDYIDLYWLHRDDENRPVGEILEYLNQLVKKGKILNFGCSNWKTNRIEEAIEYANKNGIKGFVGNQNMWSYADPNIDNIQDETLVIMDQDAKEMHLSSKMAAIPYSSQANGFFSKLQKDNLSENIKAVYYSEGNLTKFKRAQKVSESLGVNIGDVVLSYLTSQAFVTVPVVGCRTKAQLEDSLKAGDLVLDQATLNYLENGIDE